jgi:type I restriction enzyme M protein
MPSVSDLLNQIWSLFRSAGIADELSIFRHIATLLISIKGSEKSGAPFSQVIEGLEATQVDRIVGLLRQASSQAGAAGTLFDRHILFRLSSMLAGGRYITPRHVVRHMVHLSNITSEHQIADFACGSGGLLVHANTITGRTDMAAWGIELSPEWVTLAEANAALHDLPHVKIESGNALRIAGPNGTLAEHTFDRILMNPPFGEKIDSTVATKALPSNWPSGGRSETALLALALHKLRSGGCAAVLAPTGLLFSNSAAESFLRTTIVEQFHLEALITLPNDAFQPFSQLQTHLFLVTRPIDSENRVTDTWLFRAQEDGYSSGRSRDLTIDPITPNDLTRVETVIDWWRAEYREQPWFHQSGLSLFRQDANDTLDLLTIDTDQTLAIQRIELYRPPNVIQRFLVISVGTEQQTITQRLLLPLNGTELPEFINDLERSLRERYELTTKDSLPTPIILHQGFALHTAVVVGSGRLLGICVAKELVQNRHYELRPDSYILQPAETAEILPPLDLLNEIQKNSQQLQQRVGRLLDYLEPIRRTEQPLLSPVLRAESGITTLQPFGILNSEQQTVWQWIQQQTIPSADPNVPTTAKPFQPKDIDGVGDADEVSNVTTSMITLIEKMGLIVPVTYAIPDNNTPTVFYRLTTEKDLWDGVTENEDEAK